MSMCYTLCTYPFAISSFSDLSRVVSCQVNRMGTQTKRHLMQWNTLSDAMELSDTEDPDVTVNDGQIVDDVRELHDSNRHNNKTLFCVSLIVCIMFDCSAQ